MSKIDSDHLISITKATIDKFLKTKDPNDCIGLYTFYYYTARWQKTNQIRCSVKYASKGLKISEARIREAKKKLKKLLLIEDIKKIDQKTKKIEGWYIKINHIFKKETINPTLSDFHRVEKHKGGESHPLGFPQSGKKGTNTLSTNRLNTLSTNNIYKDSKKNPFDIIPSFEKYEIIPTIYNILDDLIKIGKFPHKLPKDRKNPSKLIRKTISYIKMIKSGRFAREIKLEKDWEKRWISEWPNIRGYDTWREVKNLIILSLKNFVSDKQESRKVGKGIWFPKDINQFFFNSRNIGEPGKSMFLKYLNIKSKTASGYKSGWQKNKLPNSIHSSLEKFLKKEKIHFDDYESLQFWSNMNQLYSWYQKNNERLIRYNQAYHDNGWGYHCGHVENFFYMVMKYLSEEMGSKFRCRPLPIDPENSYWRNFRAYMLNGFNIELNMDSKLEKEVDHIIKKKEEDIYKDKISNEIKKIKIECGEVGMPIPSPESLRKMAKERLEEK